MKKMLALVLSAIMTLSCLMLCVGAEQNEISKLDYAGLISRRDKFDGYCTIAKSNTEDTRPGLYWHRILLRQYGNGFNDLDHIGRYLDPSIKDGYVDQENGKESAEYLAFYDYFVPQADKTGLPELYYFIKYAEIPRPAMEKAMAAFCADQKCKYADWAVDALYGSDERMIIETLMSPEYVIDMDKYKSGESQISWVHGLDGGVPFDKPFIGGFDFLTKPEVIMQYPLDKLEGWGYSDEYWLDYYTFIDYIADWYHKDYNYGWGLTGDVATVADRCRAELDRRIDIYRARVGGSPDTGDGTAARVALFAAGAVIAAAVPALVLTVKRRREEE